MVEKRPMSNVHNAKLLGGECKDFGSAIESLRAALLIEARIAGPFDGVFFAK